MKQLLCSMDEIQPGLYMHDKRLLLLGKQEDSNLYAAKLILPSDRENEATWENLDQVVEYIRQDVPHRPHEGIYWHANFPMDANSLDYSWNPSDLKITGSYFGGKEFKLYGEEREKFLNHFNQIFGSDGGDEMLKELYFDGNLNLDSLNAQEVKEGPRTWKYIKGENVVCRVVLPFVYDVVEDNERLKDATNVWQELKTCNLDDIPELEKGPYTWILGDGERPPAPDLVDKIKNGIRIFSSN